jgi:hypothetical protein
MQNVITQATAATAASSTIATVDAIAVQTVVTNDITATPAQAIAATKDIRTAIDTLVTERMYWQDHANRTSNDQLYGLLQKCFALYKELSGSSAEAAAQRDALRDYISLKSYKFASGTHTIVKIVKCVFGMDRRRISAYGIVLRAALAQNISVMDIPQFIRDAGGVEELRLAKAPNAKTVAQKAAIAGHTVVVNNLGVVASAGLSCYFNDTAKAGANVVLVGAWQSDGSVVVRAVVESDTAINTALASHYSKIKDLAKSQAAEQKTQNTEESKQQAIQAAVVTAVAA